MIPLQPPPPPPPPDNMPKRRGRKPGTKNRATIQREQALAAAMGAVEFSNPKSAVELLRSVMAHPGIPLVERLACAKILAGFEAARPAPAPPPKDAGPLAKRLAEAYARTGRGDLAPPSTPGLSPEEADELARLLR